MAKDGKTTGISPEVFPGDIEAGSVPQKPTEAADPDKYDGKPVAVWNPRVPGIERRVLTN